jgi:SAM-dependent methyltransferase
VTTAERRRRLERRHRWTRAAKGTLQRLGVLGATARLDERRRAWGARDEPATAADGLPLPPARLRVLVAGTAEPERFLEAGERAAASVREALAVNGVALESCTRVLDWGCGCGRVLRHWHGVEGAAFVGIDFNAELVGWVRDNLPHAEARRNELAPPLPADEGEFDLAYALSVYTHLPEELQRDWTRELARVVRPGGHVVLSTHGDSYASRMSPEERRRYDAGELVVHFGELAGANICSTFHPAGWVARELAEPSGFEVVDVRLEGARGNGHQDLYVLRRRAG